MTGLECDTAQPDDYHLGLTWIRDLVAKLVETIVVGSAKKIRFVKQLSGGPKEVPSAEVFFDSAETALAIRHQFVEKKKSGIDYGRIAMQNVTTLATRIRIDVLFMIAKTCTKDGENLFVKQFISKPVLLVKSKDKFEYALTFTDAVQRYGGQIKESDFSSIYKRIGAAFPDQLEQTFVVLGEGGRMDREKHGATPSRGSGYGVGSRSDKRGKMKSGVERVRGGSRGRGWPRGGRDGRGREGGGRGRSAQWKN